MLDEMKFTCGQKRLHRFINRKSKLSLDEKQYYQHLTPKNLCLGVCTQSPSEKEAAFYTTPVQTSPHNKELDFFEIYTKRAVEKCPRWNF